MEEPGEIEPVVISSMEACGATASAEEEEVEEKEGFSTGDLEGGHKPWLRVGAYAWVVSGSSQVKIAPLA